DSDRSRFEIRPVAFLCRLDMARERQADVARKHQRTARGAIIEHLASAHLCLRGIRVLREIPVRIIDLQQMMPEVANEGRALAFLFQLEKYVTRGMTWC